MKRTGILSLLISILVIVFFCITLNTWLYGYILFIMLGTLFHILSRVYGKGIYLFMLLPLIFISVNILDKFLLLDYYNRNDINPLKIHPLTVAWLTAFFFEAVEYISHKKLKIDATGIIVFLILSVFFIVTVAKRGMNGLPLLIECYIGPLSLYIFYYYRKKDLKDITLKAIKVFIIIACVMSLFGLIEYIAQFNPLGELYDSSSSWFSSTFLEGYRIKTLIGHPLVNAVVFLLAMIFTHIIIREKKLRYFLLGLFLCNILITGSRSIFLLGILLLLFNNKKLVMEGKLQWKGIGAGIIIMIFAIVLLFYSPFGSTMILRTATADSSTTARLILIDYFVKNIASFNIKGLGYAVENINIFNNYNNKIILENPWIILFMDMSYLSLIYLGFVVLTIKKTGYVFLTFIFVLALSASNSFGVKTNLNYMFYYFMSCLQIPVLKQGK